VSLVGSYFSLNGVEAVLRISEILGCLFKFFMVTGVRGMGKWMGMP